MNEPSQQNRPSQHEQRNPVNLKAKRSSSISPMLRVKTVIGPGTPNPTAGPKVVEKRGKVLGRKGKPKRKKLWWWLTTTRKSYLPSHVRRTTWQLPRQSMSLNRDLGHVSIAERPGTIALTEPSSWTTSP